MALSGWCQSSQHTICPRPLCTCHCHTTAPTPDPVVPAAVKAKRRKILDKMVEDAEKQGLYDDPEMPWNNDEYEEWNDPEPEDNNKEQEA